MQLWRAKKKALGRSADDAPCERRAAALERGSDEDAVDEVVEEVADAHLGHNFLGHNYVGRDCIGTCYAPLELSAEAVILSSGTPISAR